jgi:tetratricopeptide (TPR) repeat protein
MAAKNQDPDLAIREASAALQADETSVDAMVLLAHGNFAKGYLDMAEDILGKALARGGSTNKQAHFLMGLILDRTDRLDKAMRQYEAAVAIDPNYSSAVMNLGVHYLRNKRYSDALTLYQRLTGELGYSSPAAFTNLGSALRGHSADFNTTDIAKRNDLLLKAEHAYKRAVSVKKDYGNAYYNLGLLYLDADPFPAGNGDMDRLKRLTQAKTYFDEYRRLPGADQTLADEQVGVAQKLIDREEKLRKKAADRAARDAAKAAAAKKKAEEAAKKGKKPTDDDEGFQ